MRRWNLDEAGVYYERAVREYRRLGLTGHDLATHLQGYAKSEFMNGDFAHAEELLNEAVSLHLQG
jgi:Flp pilus assembly protein TadD